MVLWLDRRKGEMFASLPGTQETWPWPVSAGSVQDTSAFYYIFDLLTGLNCDHTRAYPCPVMSWNYNMIRDSVKQEVTAVNSTFMLEQCQAVGNNEALTSGQDLNKNNSEK